MEARGAQSGRHVVPAWHLNPSPLWRPLAVGTTTLAAAQHTSIRAAQLPSLLLDKFRGDQQLPHNAGPRGSLADVGQHSLRLHLLAQHCGGQQAPQVQPVPLLLAEGQPLVVLRCVSGRGLD